MPRIFKKIICISLVLCLSCFLLSCYMQKSVSNKHLIEEYSDSSSYTEFYAKLREWHFDEDGNVIISVYIPVDYDKLSGWKPEYAFEAKILLKTSFDEATSNGLNFKTDECQIFSGNFGNIKSKQRKQRVRKGAVKKRPNKKSIREFKDFRMYF